MFVDMLSICSILFPYSFFLLRFHFRPPFPRLFLTRRKHVEEQPLGHRGCGPLHPQSPSFTTILQIPWLENDVSIINAALYLTSIGSAWYFYFLPLPLSRCMPLLTLTLYLSSQSHMWIKNDRDSRFFCFINTHA